jgi:phage replication O-like protein O
MHQRNTTAVPNYILDSALRLLKEVELKVLLVIIRQTVGWQKDHDWISTTQLCSKTGSCRKAVLVAVKSLIHHNLIHTRSHEGRTFFRLAWNCPPHENNLPQSKEHISFSIGKNLPPTKYTLTKSCKEKNFPREDTKAKMQEVRNYLIAQGII